MRCVCVVCGWRVVCTGAFLIFIYSQSHTTFLQECQRSGVHILRTLGWVWTVPQPAGIRGGAPLQPLFRCFDNVTKDHSVSTLETCDGQGTKEMLLGYLYYW